jgi:4-amino-4-deoxy-L-arabinose transferase-like glycosyltransferase
MATDSRWIFSAAVLGFALRLAFGLFYWTDQPLTRDEQEYLSLSRSLAAGHGFVYDEEMLKGPIQPFGRAPGYPFFLALTGGGSGIATSVPASVKVAQALVGALGVVVMSIIAGNLAGSRAARAAALITAVYPPLVFIAGYAFSEALFWPLGLLTAWAIDRVTATGRPGLAVAAGILAGLSVLVRPGLLLFLPLAGLWLLLRRGLGVAAALTVGVALALGPWTVRNYIHDGRLVVVASEGGITFWTGNHPLAIGDGDMAANPALKRANQELRARYPDVSEHDFEPIYYREALAWIKAHPIDWLILEARKLFYLVVPIGPSYTLHSTRYMLTSALPYLFVLVLGIAGIWRLGRRAGRTPGLWLLALSAVASALVFFPQERYRLPIIDPTLIIGAAALWMTPSKLESSPS